MTVYFSGLRHLTHEALLDRLVALWNATGGPFRILHRNDGPPEGGTFDLTARMGPEIAGIDVGADGADGLLERALGHLGWFQANRPTVERMLTEGGPLPPRSPIVVLVAPSYPSVLLRAVGAISGPRFLLYRYLALTGPATAGFGLDPVRIPGPAAIPAEPDDLDPAEVAELVSAYPRLRRGLPAPGGPVPVGEAPTA